MKLEVFILGGQSIDQKGRRSESGEARGNEEMEKRED